MGRFFSQPMVQKKNNIRKHKLTRLRRFLSSILFQKSTRLCQGKEGSPPISNVQRYKVKRFRRLSATVIQKSTRLFQGKEEPPPESIHFYDLNDIDTKGRIIQMRQYRGDVILVMNVASRCSLSRDHYLELPKLIRNFGERGFKILAFPCNQFGWQHNENDTEHKSIILDCIDDISWLKTADVNGNHARAVFNYLKYKIPHADGSHDIKWNFTKFLIDHEGNPSKRYEDSKYPDEICKDIEYLLERRGPSKMELRNIASEKKLSSRSCDIFMG